MEENKKGLMVMCVCYVAMIVLLALSLITIKLSSDEQINRLSNTVAEQKETIEKQNKELNAVKVQSGTDENFNLCLLKQTKDAQIKDLQNKVTKYEDAEKSETLKELYALRDEAEKLQDKFYGMKMDNREDQLYATGKLEDIICRTYTLDLPEKAEKMQLTHITGLSHRDEFLDATNRIIVSLNSYISAIKH